MIENNSINNETYVLGQYMTKLELTENLIEDIKYDENSLYIEPSFGTGNFIRTLIKLGIPSKSIIGCELDEKLYITTGELEFIKYNINFYDWDFSTNKKIVFIGNPPFRTPAYSLRTHPKQIKDLCKKYDIKGIREESVFFILKCLEIIEKNQNGGEIRFILPKSIFTNNSKFFLKFQELIRRKFEIEYSTDIRDGSFDSASLNMIFIVLKYRNNLSEIKSTNYEEYWDYNKIFKRTYLGSVPCESIFLSCRGENLENFKKRLSNIYTCKFNELDSKLRFNGYAHLKVLNGNKQELKDKKLKVIWSYLEEVRYKIGDKFLFELNNSEFYKIINHRNEHRFYFRHPKLKKMSFVYEINPNPCKSFYFTGNPSKSSTDYFGFCDYDITRNSSPGACRTIPIEGLEENLNDDFKLWWNENNLGQYNKLFDIIVKVSKSSWYKEMKKKYNRFYFGIPKDLNKID
jgi:hypothetical protein